MTKTAPIGKIATSIGILVASLGLTYAPLPGLSQTIVVVSGTELQEPLEQLETKFEEAYPNLELELKFQGSQDMVNNYIDDKNDFTPTVLIPASGEILEDLRQRWQSVEGSEPFYDEPTAIARTMLVGIAWSERGKALFPTGRFDWQRVEQAMQAGSWQAVGGNSAWGSFDFVTTDPTRSNSGQLTLGLWVQKKTGGALNAASLNSPAAQGLFGLVKRSVYQPPRSTDILLQEFIARGPNDADVATVYESIALYRWEQAAANQGKPYQIYYLDPTVETVSTAAIVQRDVSKGKADAARTLIEFLTAPEQQEVFVRFGFRPATSGIDLAGVTGSPWSQNIPGAEVDPPIQTIAPLEEPILAEIQRSWQRVN